MKRLVFAVFGLATLVGLAFYVSRPGPAPAVPVESSTESTPDQTSESPQSVRPRVAKTHPLPQLSNELRERGREPSAAGSSNEPGPKDFSTLNYSIGILVSPQATYEQKQAVWKQLREAGQLDQCISALERKAAEDPGSAAYPAALGQAYLQKCATVQDVREQGILAMQADKVFDTALRLDPANWDARFTKAVALSYWPASMNKGQEVIDHFQTLVQQQETQAPQPQFAETYLKLGDQYQKLGQADEARATWQRGAALFPNYAGLASRLTSAPQPTQ